MSDKEHRINMAEASAREAYVAAEYSFTLFVAGNESNSRAARNNLFILCESSLRGRCRVEVVDVLDDFTAAVNHGVLVTPTLIADHDGQVISIIGDLSDTAGFRAALGIQD
ncbi:MAG: circadian clock KaiB family protein [Thiogranum sp.]|nr:circadian clock KaiB family protein [Thiogranum sp.]